MTIESTLFSSLQVSAFPDNVSLPSASKINDAFDRQVRYGVQYKKIQQVQLNNLETRSISFPTAITSDWRYIAISVVGAARINTVGVDTDNTTVISGFTPTYGTEIFPGKALLSTYNLTSLELLGQADGTVIELFAAIVEDEDDPSLQYISATCTALTATTVADTDVSVAGMSIVVPAGRWLLGYNVCGGVQRFPAAFAECAGRIRLFNSTTAANVTNTEALFSATLSSTNNISRFSVARSTLVDLAVTTTFSVRVACNEAAANAIAFVDTSSVTLTGTLTNPDNQSIIWALRQS